MKLLSVEDHENDTLQVYLIKGAKIDIDNLFKILSEDKKVEKVELLDPDKLMAVAPKGYIWM